MQEVLIEIINSFGYIGIASLIFIENIFPPIPSEVVLVFGGFMTTHTEMNVALVVVAATIGATAGATVLYLIGRMLKKEKIKALFSGKFGKMMHLKPDDVTKAETWFVRYEYKAVLICRCIPVIRSLISIPAGMSRMKLFPFFTLTILGTAVWNTAIVCIGALTGDAWERSLKYIGWYSKVAIVLLIVVVIVVGYIVYKKKKNGRSACQPKDGE